MSTPNPVTSYNFPLLAAALAGSGSPSPAIVVYGRDPTTTDLAGPSGQYTKGQLWFSTSSANWFGLEAISAGSATWVIVSSGSGSLTTLTGNSGGATSPSAGNINILGAGALAFAGSGSTLTGSITPGTTLISTLTGGSGGALSPTAGNFNLLGTANQITSTGGGSTITFSIPAAFTAPGSVTATTTLTATSGNITATNGNFVLGTLGKKIIAPTGTNASIGTSGVMSGTPGSVTVATTASSSSAQIFYSRAVAGGTLGHISITAQDSTGFTLTSTANETSNFNWWIVNV